jgi:hypothetical protein
MNYRRVMVIVLSLSVVAMVACSGISQKSAESTKPEGSPITVKGKIDFMKNLGGYFVLGDVPAREYIIMNENPKVLEELFKSGRIVTIEGRIVRGAEYLFIDKIDGQPYTGKQ